MATVLVSFIGIGIPTEADTNSKSGYRTAKYEFPAEKEFEGEKIESSIFGSVLLKRLKNMNRQVSRWLILGTEQSIWDDLIDVFPQNEQDDLLEIWNEITNHIPKRGKFTPETPIAQELLDSWQNALSEKLEIEVACRLVGDCTTQESQESVYRALLEVVQNEDKIVMDITHGLRHQPVLTSFMVMFLRWYRKVKQVEIYSGVLELDAKVIKLDLCGRMLESTESLAIYQNTGNYSPLGRCLNLSDEFSENVSALRFADEINRSDRQTPKKLRQELNNGKLNSFQQSLKEELDEALSWTEADSFAKRLGHKAIDSFNHKQYLKAIILLWEAVLVAGCQKYKIGNADSKQARNDAEEKLYKELKGNDRETLKKIEWLRNSVAHSSRTSDTDVQRALSDESAFQKLFEKGWNLFQKLL